MFPSKLVHPLKVSANPPSPNVVRDANDILPVKDGQFLKQSRIPLAPMDCRLPIVSVVKLVQSLTHDANPSDPIVVTLGSEMERTFAFPTNLASNELSAKPTIF